MSGQKYFVLAAAVGFGIFNGYYVFNQSLKEEKQKRDGTYLSQTLEPETRPDAPLKDKPEADQN